MENFLCCNNGNHDNFLTCKNCNVYNVHYYKDSLQNKTDILICSICKIETPIQKEAKQIKLLL